MFGFGGYPLAINYHNVRLLTLLLAALLVGCSTTRETLYTQHVTFPEGATPEEKVDMASRVVPSREQLAWQELELTAFIHFGMNTFTDSEWGDGNEDPKLFNPTALDCEQWVTTLKRGGFRMVILTAKHHDGFCLWPTTTTEHSVANSPWREGKGDVVRELSEACRKHGLKFGVYLSPWDRNAECYGDSPAYNAMFIEQLTELLTNYGRVDEVWFDGACAEGPNGKRQEYDWVSILATIERLQPHAVTAIMGDDVRWVGNEGGRGRTTEWSATPYTPKSLAGGTEANAALGLEEMSRDLGSRELIARSNGVYWYPSEVDVSIRPGWFYHSWQNENVRSLANLVDIYYTSVGRNSVLLLNIPPDRRGLIHEIDAERIAAFGDYIENNFHKSLIKGKVGYWNATEGDSREFRVKEGKMVNTLLLQEDICRGQRVERFTVEAFVNGQWRYIAEGTTIGYKRMLHFSDCRTERIRVTINECRTEAHISNVALYYGEPIEDNQRIIRTSEISTEGWTTPDIEAHEAIDGDLSTAWHSDSLQRLTIDLGEVMNIAGFCYAPDTENSTGTIFRYNLYLSDNGTEWTECANDAEFSNIKNNPTPYFVRFGRSYSARYLRLEPKEEIDGRNATSVAEFGVLLAR